FLLNLLINYNHFEIQHLDERINKSNFTIISPCKVYAPFLHYALPISYASLLSLFDPLIDPVSSFFSFTIFVLLTSDFSFSVLLCCQTNNFFLIKLNFIIKITDLNSLLIKKLLTGLLTDSLIFSIHILA